MPDTTTPKLGLTKPEVGASSDTWGTKINADFDVVDGLFDTGPVLKLTKGGTGAATAADARTNLGLGTMATQSASAVAVTGGTISGATISGITDLAVADGGTGASTAADARTNLGLGALATKSSIASADIADGAVAYADIQNVSATSRVLGRKTAGAGSIEELTLSELLDFVGSSQHGDFLYRGASGWARLGAGTSGQLLSSNGNAANPSWKSVAAAPDVIIEDQKASGTAGGTATNDAWITRALNTLYRNAGSISTLSANQFTLPAGEYYITASAPFYWAQGFYRLRLYNVTDATVVRLGDNAYAAGGSSPDRPNSINAELTAAFSIAAQKTFRLEYYINANSGGTSGLGVASGLGTEIYSRVNVWKVG